VIDEGRRQDSVGRDVTPAGAGAAAAALSSTCCATSTAPNLYPTSGH